MSEKRARDIMTKDPATCTRDANLFDVARLMAEHECGAIPVLESTSNRQPIGIITDRDIACRGVARAFNAYVKRVEDCMTCGAITAKADTDLAECRKLMERNRVRRLIVTDDAGNCIGIVSQADTTTRRPH
jgi:CBS domain-containing protein